MRQQATAPFRKFERILVVEDDETLRRIIVRNLRARRHEVIDVATAKGAIERALDGRPDLIVLDINLPDGSGWDVLREMRRQGKNVPVVVISAVRADPIRLEEFRPLAFFPKPFSIEALLSIVAAGAKRGELVP